MRGNLGKIIVNMLITSLNIYFNTFQFITRVDPSGQLFKSPFWEDQWLKKSIPKGAFKRRRKEKLYTNPFIYPILTNFCKRIAFIQTCLFS
jgi:hypothetical protein